MHFEAQSEMITHRGLNSQTINLNMSENDKCKDYGWKNPFFFAVAIIVQVSSPTKKEEKDRLVLLIGNDHMNIPTTF